MSRHARMCLPGYPYHIVQRGNNRKACFVEPETYQFYIDLWRECAGRYGVAIHAYCLMKNHIHFLELKESEPFARSRTGTGIPLSWCLYPSG